MPTPKLFANAMATSERGSAPTICSGLTIVFAITTRCRAERW